MKRITLILGIVTAFFIVFTSESAAQERVRERDVIGTWKLVIDIEEAMEEAEEELEDEDNWLGRAIVQSVGGLVEGIMDNIEIYFDFQEAGELEIYVEAFGEGENEYAEWEIRDGRLYIYDLEDSDHINIDFDDDDYWMLEDDLLVNYEESRYGDEREENVYMVRID